jgi:hypothetical protein
MFTTKFFAGASAVLSLISAVSAFDIADKTNVALYYVCIEWKYYHLVLTLCRVKDQTKLELVA